MIDALLKINCSAFFSPIVRMKASWNLYAFLALVWAMSATLSAGENNRPNILLVLADDLGWKDLGCYGNEIYKTENLDRFASEGILFQQAYAAAHVCSPTRGSIMTGLYPARTHLTDWIPGHRRVGKLMPPQWTPFLSEQHFTIGEMLKKQGYQTAWLGKWHLEKRTHEDKGKKSLPRIAFHRLSLSTALTRDSRIGI